MAASDLADQLDLDIPERSLLDKCSVEKPKPYALGRVKGDPVPCCLRAYVLAPASRGEAAACSAKSPIRLNPEPNKTGRRKPCFYRGSIPVPKLTLCKKSVGREWTWPIARRVSDLLLPGEQAEYHGYYARDSTCHGGGRTDSRPSDALPFGRPNLRAGFDKRLAAARRNSGRGDLSGPQSGPRDAGPGVSRQNSLGRRDRGASRRHVPQRHHRVGSRSEEHTSEL